MILRRIRTPRHLMPITCSVVVPTETIGSAGTPQWVYTATAVVIACNLQPQTARDSMQYGRETGTIMADLWIAPTDTSGTALTITDAQWKNSQVTVGGYAWRVVGTIRDPIKNGCVHQVILERDF